MRAGMEGEYSDILDDNGVQQIRWYQPTMFVFNCRLLQLY